MDSEYPWEGSCGGGTRPHTVTLQSGRTDSPVTAAGEELWMERKIPWFHSNMWHEWKVTRAEISILPTAGRDLQLGCLSQRIWGSTLVGEK